MVPEFPNFAHLNAEHVIEIRKMVRSLPEYSDYNPASLIAWDVHEEIKISNLHGNLVMMFTDYLDGSTFISLHGAYRIKTSMQAVFKYARNHNLQPLLKLIPEETARMVQTLNNYEILEDRDNYDYIISLENIMNMVGRPFRNMRRQVKAFKDRQGSAAQYVTLDLDSKQHVREILTVFARRESQKPDNAEESEFVAVQRLVKYRNHFELFARGVRIGDRLEAFIIIDRSDQQLLGIFWKANTKYSGIYQYLLHMCAKELYKSGFGEMNIEQDLGIEGLRIAKGFFKPSYRKKYVIREPVRVPQSVAVVPQLRQLTLSLQL